MSEEQPIEEFLIENSEEAPKGKSFDDLEAELGEEPAPSNRIEFNSLEDLVDTHDENGEPLVAPPPRLDYEQMAEITFRTIASFEDVLSPELSIGAFQWHQIEPELKQKFIARVAMIIQSASDPNDDNIARIFHAQDCMKLMIDGWRYGEAFDEAEKVTPKVIPWEYAKPEDRVQYYLFRRTVKSLLAVWNGH